MTAWLYITITLLAIALVSVGTWAYSTATRLDRLHVRYDLSWQALDSALARRAVVARAIAVDAYGGRPEGRRLKALADTAERAPRTTREGCENALSTALAVVEPAAVPVALIAELADAEARVLLARRFHNDAVRDTLALRVRRPVRWLRLGGTAAMPSYFEIAEQTSRMAAPQQDSVDAEGHPDVRLDRRTSARVVLLDDRGCVLLFCGSDPAVKDNAPRWWFTVGGQVKPGERLTEAAVREVAEETGLKLKTSELVGPVWRRDAMIDFNGTVIASQEFFFVHRTGRFEPLPDGRTELELRYIHGHRWCDVQTIDELAAGGETVYPVQLGELLTEANRVADGSHGDPPQMQPIR